MSRWRGAFQNDFAARMDWCLTNEFQAANHRSVAVLNGRRVSVTINAKPGQLIRLSAEGSQDPDGNRLSYRWYVYPDVSDVAIRSSGRTAELIAPKAAQSIPVVLDVTDDGVPALTAYRRAFIQVRP